MPQTCTMGALQEQSASFWQGILFRDWPMNESRCLRAANEAIKEWAVKHKKKKSKKWPMTSPHHSPVRWKNFGFQRIPLLAHGNPLRSSCLFQHLTLHSTMGRSNVLWDTLKTMCHTDVHSVRQPGGNWRCWCPVCAFCCRNRPKMPRGLVRSTAPYGGPPTAAPTH